MSHQDREKSKRIQETIASLSAMPANPSTGKELEQWARERIEQWTDEKLGKGNRPCGWPSFGSISVSEVAALLTRIRDEARLEEAREYERFIARVRHLLGYKSFNNRNHYISDMDAQVFTADAEKLLQHITTLEKSLARAVSKETER